MQTLVDYGMCHGWRNVWSFKLVVGGGGGFHFVCVNIGSDLWVVLLAIFQRKIIFEDFLLLELSFPGLK